MTAAATPQRDREADILDAALAVLARDGIGGVSMRAVARAADVSLGLANYHFTDKTTLICAALRRIAEQDLAIVRPDPDDDPATRLRSALHRVADDDLVDARYLALRLQLWSLAAVDASYADINRSAQDRYLDELADLIEAAVPPIDRDEARRRAGEILVIQNGIWLTAAIDDPGARTRSVEACARIAFSPAVASAGAAVHDSRGSRT
jgi:AcrR family transcriptional regulator